ncbi:aldehyde dehydrogenase [Actinomadura sp. HBU206391]|uniref:aldehyde dehydrogenase n=1 Tax=Actinomadura sp. HBU206391 TaxID=2731692 RepID=UPI0016505DEE|nr:aldehyde dehydrogenase [Actinomadura sp. HBU206391]MBC6460462.1 aldehyde dehydrogenase [Actinomadura sp. HBU206391]
MREHDRLYIGGDWAAPAGTGTIEVISPHTEEVVGRVPDGTPADIDRAVAAAREAFDNGPWPRMTPVERADVVARLAALYAERLGDFAEIITAEMGSPILFSHLAQAPMPQLMLAYFADLARTFPWEEERPGMLGPVTVRREPVGVVAAIVPWNVPQFVTMTKLAPALVAGCSVVLKPAPETPLDAYLLAELVQEAGVPAGVVNIVAAGRETGEHLVSHPGVDKVAFTGSTAAGRRIAAICGEQLKRCSLELGGKSAAVICDDADLAATMEGLKMAALMNNGQACAAQTRILAPRGRYDEVADALSAMVGGLAVGDPSDMGTEIGPLVAKRQQDRVEGYIRLGQEEGAKVLTGGLDRPHDRGWYVAPTVFGDVGNDMRIAREEIFGPVLVLIPYEDEADAVRIANDSEYGLGGSVWTADVERGADIARRIRTGSCGINHYIIDVNTPFGGYKSSGIGRELGPEGLSAYLEQKAIARLAPPPA